MTCLLILFSAFLHAAPMAEGGDLLSHRELCRIHLPPCGGLPVVGVFATKGKR
jgi:hypothetical protein